MGPLTVDTTTTVGVVTVTALLGHLLGVVVGSISEPRLVTHHND